MSYRYCAFTLVLGVSLACGSAHAQEFVVASRQVGNPATALTLCDAIPGTVTPLASFGNAVNPPRAIAADPINRDLIVALESGTSTVVVRLTYSAATLINEQILANFPGDATDLAVDSSSGIWVALDGPQGGLLRLARNSGQALAFFPYPRTVAFEIAYPGTGLLVQQVPGGNALLRFVDLTTGAAIQTIPVLSAPGERFTGATDLPTGAIRQAMSSEASGLFRFEFLSTLNPWALNPAIPVGSPVEIGPGGQGIMVLGGAGFPYLATVPIFASNLVLLAGPLPGSPVDFTEKPSIGPALIRFGSPCPQGGSWSSQGLPQLGSTTFSIGLQGGVPNRSTALLLGVSDQVGFGQSLPWTIAPACEVHTSADIALVTTSSVNGDASFVLPIPLVPAWAGSILFGQWIQENGGTPILSDAFAAHLAL